MTGNIKNIAARIKDLREIAGISPETLAKEVNVSRETYVQYESGAVDIPVSFIYSIAQRLGVEMSDLLTGESPRLHVYALTRKGKGVGVERTRRYTYQSLAYNFMHKKGEPFLVTVDPESASTPGEVNSHPGQEFTYVLEGKLKVTIDGHEVVLDEGDSLYFDATYGHAMQALDGKPARFLAVIL
jgi:transcriptional regulator with XRE-family HTH domain